jgi:hypothetical protein
MNNERLPLPRQARIRIWLRRLGLTLLALGALLTLIGIGSFFSSLSSFASFDAPRFPRLFWCAFLGMPLLFAGSVLTLFGFLGALQRYTAAETAPVAKDVANYMGENTQPGAKALARALTEGVAEALEEKRQEKHDPDPEQKQ